MEFDVDCAPSKSVLGRDFYEGLRPLIKLWIVKEGQKLDGWDDLIKKATRAEAKTKLQSIFTIREINQGCPQGNRPSQVSTSRNKAMATWDPRNEPIASIEDT